MLSSAKLSRVVKHLVCSYCFINTPILIFAQFSYEWALTAGAGFTDAAYDMAVDDDGDIYIVGFIATPCDFDPTDNTVFPFETANSNAYFAKYSCDRELIFVKSIGSNISGSESGYKIDIDTDKNIYISGHIDDNADMDPGPGEYILETISGTIDGFIAKYDSTGNLIYAKNINTTAGPPNIELDHNLNIITYGVFNNEMDFDLGPNEYILGIEGLENPYLAKYSNNGGLIFAHAFDTLSNNAVYTYLYIVNTTTDLNDNIYITGLFRGAFDFKPGTDVHVLSSMNETLFLAKYDPTGNLIYAIKFDSGFETNVGYPEILLDSDGNIHISGSLIKSLDFDAGPDIYNLTSLSLFDIFWAKYTNDGNFIFAKILESEGDSDFPSNLLIDQEDHIYMSGTFSGLIDFDPGSGEAFHDVDSYADMFIAKYDKEGNYLTSVSMGGAYQDVPFGMALDHEGNIYLAGEFYEEINPFPGGEDYYYSNGYQDIFVAKYSQNLVPVTEPTTTSLVADVKPNPGTGLYRINLPDATANLPICITDITGTTIKAGYTTTGSEVLIDIQDAPAGVYFVQIGTGVAVQTLKLMKL